MMRVDRRENYILRKLRANKGESLAETLVAALITALAALLFATMMTSSTRIISKSEVTMDSYYEELSTQSKAAPGEDKTLTFRSSDDITDRTLIRDVYGNVHSSQTVHLSKVGEGDTQVIKYKGN